MEIRENIIIILCSQVLGVGMSEYSVNPKLVYIIVCCCFFLTLNNPNFGYLGILFLVNASISVHTPDAPTNIQYIQSFALYIPEIGSLVTVEIGSLVTVEIGSLVTVEIGSLVTVEGNIIRCL